MHFQTTNGIHRTITPETIDEYIVCLEKEKDLYKCGICQRNIKQRAEVRRHLRAVHLNVRNQICSFCHAAFTNTGNRKRHEKSCKQKPKCMPLPSLNTE